MRIAVVTNRYPVDAQDTASPFVGDFCRALEQLGYPLHVVTPFYPPERPERDPWVTRFKWIDSDRVLGQLPLRTTGGLLKAFHAYTAGRTAVLQSVQQFRPDYILALWALPSGLWARTASRAFNIPYGVWCLGSDIQLWGRKPIARSLIRGILRESRHCYADGFALAEETARLARRSCEFLPSLRELQTERSGPAASPVTGQPYFIYFGRLAADKGVLDLLAAMEHMRGEDTPHLVFAGTPDPDLDLPGEIARRQLDDTCHYAGPLDAREAARCLRDARAVLLPSHRDSIPLVFGEAMQCRTPVICSNLPDFRAVLQRYPVGTIASHASPEVWAGTLRNFVPDPAWEHEMARFCHDFSPARAAQRFVSDIRDSLSGAPPSSAAPQQREQAHA